MKVIHLTDLHISPDPVMNCDSIEPCEAALRHIARFHTDADLIVVTGDLSDHGDRESYLKLRQLLMDAGLADDPRLRLLLGNHDDRKVFQSVFPETPKDSNGFTQWAEKTESGLFVYLDTHEPGTNTGHFCEDRSAWLDATLSSAQADNTPAWLFMHHNPTPVHVLSADSIGLLNGSSFRTLIGKYRDIVRHIAFGHCHFTLSGSLHGVPLSANRGTARALWPGVEQPQPRFATGPLERHYNVMLINDESTVIHSIDFERQDEVVYLGSD
ncbi:metallophosphoesterase [Granulosicoccus sp. 3-233]|uniref:metallophosphoesterase n=1 Tax=Granulosicoccus sp. 3-233 TaxID=3417969 RepID=UPI003D35495E